MDVTIGNQNITRNSGLNIQITNFTFSVLHSTETGTSGQRLKFSLPLTLRASRLEAVANRTPRLNFKVKVFELKKAKNLTLIGLITGKIQI